MLLAIDIGNSTIKLGVFDREHLITRLVLPTRRDLSARDLSVAELPKDKISAVVISSVVPELDEAFRRFAAERLRAEAFFVDHRFDFGFAANYEPPGSIGSDRLVAAFAAREKYGAPAIVCSFGTATTIDALDASSFRGGVIAPGVGTLSEALYLKTSKLPRVEIGKPETVIGRSTVDCIRAGIFYGYVGLTEGILKRMIDELGVSPRVVATGGYAALIAGSCPLIGLVDERLVLDGLRLIGEKISRQHKSRPHF